MVFARDASVFVQNAVKTKFKTITVPKLVPNV